MKKNPKVSNAPEGMRSLADIHLPHFEMPKVDYHRTLLGANPHVVRQPKYKPHAISPNIKQEFEDFIEVVD